MMPRIIMRPALATLFLHGLLIYLLTVNWTSTDREVTRVKPVPNVINARLVDISEFQPKAQPKPKPKPVAPKQPAPQPKPEPKKPEPKPEPKPQQEQAEATATAGEMSASFVALIQRTVVNYWSRPPSARNGMEAELAIQLIPTGEVVSVTIIRSSGNSAFDRSAVNAVETAGAFPELQQLPNGEFEKTFRRFRLLFKPEDLRY
jgi:TonB family protein